MLDWGESCILSYIIKKIHLRSGHLNKDWRKWGVNMDKPSYILNRDIV